MVTAPNTSHKPFLIPIQSPSMQPWGGFSLCLVIWEQSDQYNVAEQNISNQPWSGSFGPNSDHGPVSHPDIWWMKQKVAAANILLIWTNSFSCPGRYECCFQPAVIDKLKPNYTVIITKSTLDCTADIRTIFTVTFFFLFLSVNLLHIILPLSPSSPALLLFLHLPATFLLFLPPTALNSSSSLFLVLLFPSPHPVFLPRCSTVDVSDVSDHTHTHTHAHTHAHTHSGLMTLH